MKRHDSIPGRRTWAALLAVSTVLFALAGSFHTHAQVRSCQATPEIEASQEHASPSHPCPACRAPQVQASAPDVLLEMVPLAAGDRFRAIVQMLPAVEIVPSPGSPRSPPSIAQH